MQNSLNKEKELSAESSNGPIVTRFKKGSQPWNKGKSHLVGDKNPSWKGDSVGYGALHDWLRRNYGKGTQCEHCQTQADLNAKRWNIEWSLIKGKVYERKRENFILLCAKCHTKYDNKVPAGWNRGRKETRLEVLERQSISHIGIKPNRIYYRRSHE